jgi:hypothetical protein
MLPGTVVCLLDTSGAQPTSVPYMGGGPANWLPYALSMSRMIVVLSPNFMPSNDVNQGGALVAGPAGLSQRARVQAVAILITGY